MKHLLLPAIFFNSIITSSIVRFNKILRKLEKIEKYNTLEKIKEKVLEFFINLIGVNDRIYDFRALLPVNAENWKFGNFYSSHSPKSMAH